ncbi:hypothetical protein BJX61DRAFT_230533 [Aspergillus egyptiacus]|nr:hypothetical protein BJX61DRAFT_230533 [Aspergillus egyptiacus]
MLKPFRIRDLHDDPPSKNVIEDSESDLYGASDVISEGSNSRDGLVQLSAADYDEIAYLHPKARLTYLDDDDGETITVGSSLELTQRLDEPPPPTTDTTNFSETIHLFDIRRSKSVRDLWKRYQRRHDGNIESLNTVFEANHPRDHSAVAESDTSDEPTSRVENNVSHIGDNDTSESFLSAFETEMARLMNSWRTANEDGTAERSSSPRQAQTESRSNIPRDTTQAFASALRNLMEVAEIISSGVKSKLPELEKHLDNARRALPRDMTDSMRNAFIVLEEQVKAMAAILNNLPETIRRENRPGGAAPFPEIPAPFSPIRGLRELSLQLGGIGQTVLETLDSSVRGAFPGYQNNYSPSFPGFPESNQRSSVPDNGLRDTPVRSGESISGPTTCSEYLPPPILPQRDAISPSHVISETVTDQRNSSQQLPQPSPSHSFSYPFALSPFPVNFSRHPWPFPAIPSHGNHNSWDSHRSHHSFGPSPTLPRFNDTVHGSAPYNATSGGHTVTQPDRPHTHSSSERPGSDSQSTRLLFIGNIGFSVTEKMVKDVFTSMGLVVDVNLPLDSRTHKHAGFGYLTFSTAADAARALRDVQGTVIDGHCINLEYLDHVPVTSVTPLDRAEQVDSAARSSSQASEIIRSDASCAGTLDSPTASGIDNPPAGPFSSWPNGDTDLSNPSSPSMHDMLPAQAEARYPPVSQLDAHMVAGQSSWTRPTISGGAENAPDSGECSGEPRAEMAGAAQGLPGSFPLDDHDNASTRRCVAPQPVTIAQRPAPSPHRLHHSPQPNPGLYPRRSVTVRVPESQRRLFNPFEASPPLRRRATERHSLRARPPVGMQTGLFGPRHRASFHHLSQPIPSEARNASAEEPNAQADEESSARAHREHSSKERAIDECVAALAQLGYGDEDNGGLQRMEIYAAAAQGELIDAIEMIEEERKAYEQRG